MFSKKATTTTWFAGMVLVLLLSGCESNPVTLALHNPIFPSAGQAVTYSLERVTGGTVNSAELFETVSTVNAAGTVTAGTETSLQTWTSPSGDLSFIKSAGYSANSLVTYRWVVRVQDGSTERVKNYRVTFATRPYPVTNQPAPVYVQGDPDDVFDMVFIPDVDVTDLNVFRDHCRQNIRNAFFDEPHTRLWRRQFNFYINQQTGQARAAGAGPHIAPSNNAQLAFMEGRCLMHVTDFRDKSSGGIFSTELQNRGTIMHEGGHGLFLLADEYCCDTHYFQEAELPNIWNTQAGAEGAADDYGDCKSLSDVRQISNAEGSVNWWKLCGNTCQMNNSGLTHTTFDCPCRSRITHMVFKLAGN